MMPLRLLNRGDDLAGLHRSSPLMAGAHVEVQLDELPLAFAGCILDYVKDATSKGRLRMKPSRQVYHVLNRGRSASSLKMMLTPLMSWQTWRTEAA